MLPPSPTFLASSALEPHDHPHSHTDPATSTTSAASAPTSEETGDFFKQEVKITNSESQDKKGEDNPHLHIEHTLGEEHLDEGGIVNIIITQQIGTEGYTEHIKRPGKRRARRRKATPKAQQDPCKEAQVQELRIKASCTVTEE